MYSAGIAKPLHPYLWAPGRKPLGPVEVDWSHPLSKGLIGCYLFTCDGLGEKNLAHVLSDIDLNNVPRSIGAGETCIDLNGVDQYGRLPSAGLPSGNSQISIYIKFVLRSNNDEMIFGLNNNSNVNSCDLYVNSTGMRWWTGGTSDAEIMPTPAIGTITQVTLVRTDSQKRGFIDGVLDSAVSATSNPVYDGNPLLIGADADSGAEGSLGNWADGQIFELMFWDRALTDEEVWHLNQNPYQLLRPRTNFFWVPAAAGGITISPSGIPSAEAFGSHSLSPGPVNVSPSGIASLEAFGNHSITSIITIYPTSITSAEAFGGAQIIVGPVTISPAGIGSEEAFGTANVGSVLVLNPTGIASLETFGSHALTVGPVELLPAGIGSEEAFGLASVDNGAAQKARWFVRMKGEIIGTLTVTDTNLTRGH